MKKFVLTAFIIAFVGFKSFGQQTAGAITVGGQFTLESETEKAKNGNATQTGDKTTRFTLLPSVEYFLQDELSIGIGAGYTMEKVKHNSGNTTTNGMFLINPYARKYFSLGDKVYLFGEGEVVLGFGSYKSEQNGSSVKYNSSMFQVGVVPGIRYIISNRVALEGSFGFIGYTRNSQDTGTDTSQSTNTITFDFDASTLQFGIRFFL